jgi:hypothetical protein
MALTLIVTDAGRAALVNASNSGTAAVTIAHVGVSASGVAPSRTAAALPGEIKRIATLSGDVVAADTIHLIVRDESNDAYRLRSFALYLADGTLFAIYGQPDVILEKSSQALMLLAIDVQFPDIAATQLTFGDTNFLNPPATTERQGVVELATVAEARAGADALRALTPAAAKAAILGWLLGQDGSGSGLDADLLDGQQGSWYANIPQRLGYSPANAGGQIFGGPVGRAPSFYLDMLGDNPIIVFSPSANITQGRALEELWFTLGGSIRHTMTKDALVIGGNAAWHAGNDGSGSGLDADLLDGQQGSWYANIPQRLGFSPANAGGQIFGGPVGRAPSFYLDMLGDNPIIVFSPSANITQGRALEELWFTLGGSIRHTMTKDALVIGGNIAWHAGNDGSGSGLDADMVDGFDASAFLRDVGSSFGENGYLRLSNGLILQWGTIAGTFAAHQDIYVTFPIRFPSATLSLVGANSDVAAQASAVVGFNYSPPPGPDGFNFRTSVSGQNRLNWFAIGF